MRELMELAGHGAAAPGGKRTHSELEACGVAGPPGSPGLEVVFIFEGCALVSTR